MNTIKHLKEDKIELNGLVYKPYKICELPPSFGIEILDWINYRGYTYVAEQNMKEILIAEQMAINITNWPLLIIILIIGIIIGNKIKQMNKHELEKEVEWLQVCNQEMQVLIDILWEFVSEKDVDKVSKKLREYEQKKIQQRSKIR